MVMCSECGVERVADLNHDEENTLHYRRIKVYPKDPILEAMRLGINVFANDGKIRSDVYDFIVPEFVYYELLKCSKHPKK